MTAVSSYKADGSLFYNWLYSYDTKGNKIEWLEYKADGSLSRKWLYSYEFDAANNWIKKTESNEVNRFGQVMVEPFKKTIRTITYYP
jgi:protein associated with RNAse G/E